MPGRRSDIFLISSAALLGLLCLLFLHSLLGVKAAVPSMALKRETVRALGLTDLCLFTDARYTRHPAVADLNTAFQDYPLSFEHFPSGSLIPPPLSLRQGGAQ